MAVKKKPASQLFYIEQAAKMCPYPVHIAEGTIDIPQDELETDDLSVAHLLRLGFHIQSCIPGSIQKTQPFDPTLRLTPRIIERSRSEFLIGDCFKIKSTECELRIFHIEKGKLHLEYTNRPGKHALLTSEEHLKRALKMETWIRI